MILKKLITWFFANTVLPIVVPVFFWCLFEWIQDGNGGFLLINKFTKLVMDGFYVFSALTLLFSLIEDSRVFKFAGIGVGYGAGIMVLVIITLWMFYQIKVKDASYIESHSIQFILVWCITVASAIYAKYRIIKYKDDIKKDDHNNETENIKESNNKKTKKS